MDVVNTPEKRLSSITFIQVNWIYKCLKRFIEAKRSKRQYQMPQESLTRLINDV